MGWRHGEQMGDDGGSELDGPFHSSSLRVLMDNEPLCTSSLHWIFIQLPTVALEY